MRDSSGLGPGIVMRRHCNQLEKEWEARFSCLLALVAGVWLLSQVPPSFDAGRLLSMAPRNWASGAEESCTRELMTGVS